MFEAILFWHGHLAQLGEHFLDVEGVRGSSPLVPIGIIKRKAFKFNEFEAFLF